MKHSTLILFPFLCGALLFTGCAGLSTLTETALPIIERFPFGHVLDAAKEAYCAVKDCGDRSRVPAPKVPQ